MAGYGRDESFPPSLVANGFLFAGGYLAAHLAIRRFAPTADPVFLPAAGLLAGLGFAVIFRLEPDLGAEQAGWLAVGLFAFVGRPGRDPRPPNARPLHVHDRAARASCSCCCRSCRAWAGRRTHDQRRAAVVRDRPAVLPAGRDREGAHRHLPRVLLEREEGAARDRDPQAGPVPAPRAQAPRPRCSWRGACPWPSCSWRRTWAPRCCSSRSSS